MDIEFLLALQQWRQGMGGLFEDVTVFISDIGASVALILVVLAVYWCFDKDAGFLAAMSFCLGNFTNQFVKNLACVYRPWIIDARIAPAEGALAGATGYSFPSGHTVSSGTVMGSLAYSVVKRRRWLAVLLVAFALFIAFARNLLGVHTPQDVLVGLAEAAVMVVVGVKLSEWLKVHRDKDWMFVVGAFVLGAIVLAVITLKAYPLDYANGQLLVDPADMKKDCFEGVGILWGFWLGWFCERRWLNFEIIGVPVIEKVLRVGFGVFFLVVVFIALDPLLKIWLGLDWAKLVSRFILLACAMYVVPLLAQYTARVVAERGFSFPRPF